MQLNGWRAWSVICLLKRIVVWRQRWTLRVVDLPFGLDVLNDLTHGAHRIDGVLAHAGFAAQHDRISAVEKVVTGTEAKRFLGAAARTRAAGAYAL